MVSEAEERLNRRAQCIVASKLWRSNRRSGRLAGCGRVQRRTDPWQLGKSWNSCRCWWGNDEEILCTVWCAFFFVICYFDFSTSAKLNHQKLFSIPCWGASSGSWTRRKVRRSRGHLTIAVLRILSPPKKTRLTRLGLEHRFPLESAIKWDKSPFLDESIWKQIFGDKAQRRECGNWIDLALSNPEGLLSFTPLSQQYVNRPISINKSHDVRCVRELSRTHLPGFVILLTASDISARTWIGLGRSSWALRRTKLVKLLDFIWWVLQ